jgi:hypothetical protein
MIVAAVTGAVADDLAGIIDAGRIGGIRSLWIVERRVTDAVLQIRGVCRCLST